jgi:hypothetical protein
MYQSDYCITLDELPNLKTYQGFTSSPTDKPTPTPVQTPTSKVSPTSSTKYLDVNNDGAINMSDVVLIATSFNSVSGNSKYNAKYDLNKDGAINMVDIMLVASKFNTKV